MYREHKTPESIKWAALTKATVTTSFNLYPTAHLPRGPAGSQSGLLSELQAWWRLPDSGWSWKAVADEGPAAAASLGSALVLQRTVTSAGASEVETDWEDKHNENLNSIEKLQLWPNYYQFSSKRLDTNNIVWTSHKTPVVADTYE